MKRLIVLITLVVLVVILAGPSAPAAAPRIDATGALAWDANPMLTSGEVRSTIISTAVDLGLVGWDAAWGWGRVDAHNAVDSVVSGNNPPTVPGIPVPANHATGVSGNTDLSWTGGDPNAGDTVTYDVYFGVSSPPPFEATIGPYPATQSSITYDPGTLCVVTKYYWLILARDNDGITAGSSLWDFTTAKTGDVNNLEGQVHLQGRPAASDASWITNLSVIFLQGGAVVRTQNVTTDNAGNFTIPDVAVGTYDICVKSPRALSELKTGVVIVSGTPTSVDFGTLREGDANNDDAISLADYALLYTAYGSTPCPCDANWNDNCDFNRNGAVELGDYALLYTNYGQAGDCYAP